LEIRSADLYRAAYKPEDFPRDDRPQFAFIGRSNVGKSTLINTILKRKALARVSQTPGKTQAIQFYLINDRFYFVDLPGYGYARVPRSMKEEWGRLVRAYLEKAIHLREIFFLVDSRREPSPEDGEMKDWLDDSGHRWRLVLTKSDKLSRSQLAAGRKQIAEALGADAEESVAFSSHSRSGVDEIWREVEQVLKERSR
jgi:GTP-binding protein